MTDDEKITDENITVDKVIDDIINPDGGMVSKAAQEYYDIYIIGIYYS